MEFNNLKAALFVTIGMAMIVTNDAIVKHMSQVLGIGQIMFLRGLLVCAVFATVLTIRRQPMFNRVVLNRWNLARGAMELMATLFFLTGLSLLPIATASTLAFSSPIFLALFASLWINERVGLVRWLVILTGFFGVMLIADPFADEINWAVILPITCGVFVALRDLLIRFVPANISSTQVAFTNAWIVTLGGGVYMLVQGWGSVGLAWYLWLPALAVAIYCGYIFNIMGTRLGELSFVGPFKYTAIILAFIYGYLIWGDVPTTMMLAGAAVIIASGIYLITHEKKRSRKAEAI